MRDEVEILVVWREEVAACFASLERFRLRVELESRDHHDSLHSFAQGPSMSTVLDHHSIYRITHSQTRRLALFTLLQPRISLTLPGTANLHEFKFLHSSPSSADSITRQTSTCETKDRA